MLLAFALDQGGRYYPRNPARALAVLERGPAPAPGTPEREQWDQLERKVRDSVRAAAALAGRPRGGGH